MRKILALILVLSLILMAGCTSGSDDRGDDTSPKNSGKTDPFTQAQEHKQAGNYDDAISGFLSVIESDPKMYLSYLELADIYIRNNEFQKAYDILTLGKENVEEADLPALENKLLEFNRANVIVDSGNVPHGKAHITDAKIQWAHQYGYDIENKRLTSVTHCDGEGNVIARIDLTFNERNQPLTSYAYYTDGSIEKVEFEYNANGQLCKTNEYDTNGNPAGYSINEFDAEGYKVKESKFYADGSSHWTLIYSHNVTEKSTDLEIFFYGKSVGTSSMKFSDFGYPNSRSSRFKGSRDRSIEYDFDYFSNHVREEVIGEGTLTRIVSYNAPLSILY